jgi:hypothetical protein
LQHTRNQNSSKGQDERAKARPCFCSASWYLSCTQTPIDQSTEAAARRGRKEKKRTVYASKNKKNAPPPETVPEADWNRKNSKGETKWI